MSSRYAGQAQPAAQPPQLNLPPPIVIRTTAQLNTLLPRLMAAPAVAVDTEANSLYAYYHKVCLIQMSVRQFEGENGQDVSDYIIDPLAIEMDLRPLGALFAAPQVLKVFHAAENDVLILKRDYGFTFANVFDTLWAARILGWHEVGLGAILEKQFDVVMDKRMQRANWGKRPLTRAQLSYARLDTHFLLDLRARLEQELTQRGRLAEAHEVFASMTSVEYMHRPFDPDGFWRLRGARELDGGHLAALQAAYLWREEKARTLDQPPFKVLADQTLITLAERLPPTLQELMAMSGINPGLMRRFGGELVQAMQKAAAGPVPAPPKRVHHHLVRPDEGTAARYEALRAWRTARAAERGVDPDVVLTNDTLMTIARQAPATLTDLAACDGFGPAKQSLYGHEILTVLTMQPKAA
jgi:ribonuclease D